MKKMVQKKILNEKKLGIRLPPQFASRQTQSVGRYLDGDASGMDR